MKAKLNRPLIKAASMILPGILIASLALANGEHELQIDLETDDIRIEQMDIGHLEVGDSETIYTNEGQAVDVLRTEQGEDEV